MSGSLPPPIGSQHCLKGRDNRAVGEPLIAHTGAVRTEATRVPKALGRGHRATLGGDCAVEVNRGDASCLHDGDGLLIELHLDAVNGCVAQVG